MDRNRTVTLVVAVLVVTAVAGPGVFARAPVDAAPAAGGSPPGPNSTPEGAGAATAGPPGGESPDGANGSSGDPPDGQRPTATQSPRTETPTRMATPATPTRSSGTPTATPPDGGVPSTPSGRPSTPATPPGGDTGTPAAGRASDAGRPGDAEPADRGSEGGAGDDAGSRNATGEPNRSDGRDTGPPAGAGPTSDPPADVPVPPGVGAPPPGTGGGPPPAVGPPGSDAGVAPAPGNVTVPSVAGNATALAHRRAALALLLNGSLSGPGRSGAALRERMLADVNASFDHVLDADRVTSARVFRLDKRVAAPAWRRAPNVTAHLAESDELLARRAVADVERVRRVLRARNRSFDESAVAENLSAARAALDQAEHVRERAPHAAVEHYRQAWTHAQRAIDVMDEAVAPVVTIRTRTDPPRNGTHSRPVNATVFDVRAYELSASMTVGNETDAVALNASTVPATVATANATASLGSLWPPDDRTASVNLSARDPGVDVADQGYDREDRFDVHHPQRRGDGLLLDGDGLPDRYERTVVGTDPVDDDSDSDRTTADEAANGTIDGGEDLDGDRLITFVEFRLGLEPLDPDTDDDRLGDGFETELEGVDPSVPDTDGDGVDDGREDADADGLSNAGEYVNGTDPVANDTDGEGLSDGTEVHQHGTDPTVADTDGDGVDDAAELELGTDPLAADTDGDGVPDGSETFTTTTRDPETGATVSVTGDGNAAAGVTVDGLAHDNSSSILAARPLRVVNETAVDEATVTIPIADTVDAGATNLTIYKYDGTADSWWEPVETEVDARNRTASATVTSFSFFILVDEEEYRQRTTGALEPEWPVFENFADLSGWSGDSTLENGSLVVTNTTASDGDGDDDGGGGDDDGGGGGTNDQDGDGVPDSDDPCPDMPGTDGGCPTDERLETCFQDLRNDCDRDGVTNGQEPKIGTDLLDVDTDEDGVNDGFDNCPATAGDGPDGCPSDDGGDDGGTTDSDADGVVDSEDDCPNTPGGGLDGCPKDDGSKDSDGDGVPDSEDLCPDTFGEGTEGCPHLATSAGVQSTSTTPDGSLASGTDGDGSVATRTMTLGTDFDSIEARARVKATVENDDSAVRIVVTGPSGSETLFEKTGAGTTAWRSVSADLSRFAGERVTVEVRASGDATVRTQRFELVRDGDGDDIRYGLEQEAASIEVPVFTLSEKERYEVTWEPLGLDPEDGDTDDDGLMDGRDDDGPMDGREVELNVFYTGAPSRRELHVEVASMTAHPDKANSDEFGLEDEPEVFRDSDPRFPERIQVSASLPTIAVSQDGETGRPEDVSDADVTTFQLAILQDFTPDYDKDDIWWGVGCTIGCESPPGWLKSGSLTDWRALKEGVTWDAGDVLIRVPVHVLIEQQTPFADDYAGVSEIRFEFPEASSQVSILRNQVVEDPATGGASYDVILRLDDPNTGPNSIDIVKQLGRVRIEVEFEQGSPYRRIEDRDNGGSAVVTTKPYVYNWHYGLESNNLIAQGLNQFKTGITYAMSFGTVVGIAEGSTLLVFEGGSEVFARYVAFEVFSEGVGAAVPSGSAEVQFYRQDVKQTQLGEFFDEDVAKLYWTDVGYMVVRQN